MKKEEMTPEEKKILKLLNKLMSEEMIAHFLYHGCIAAACKCQGGIFKDLFIEIAEDELDDHFMNLKSFADENEFDVPFKFKDYEKYAEKCHKQLESLKKDEKAIYYLDVAIQSEQDAILSYEEAMADKDVPYELNAIILNNFYDEVEHLEKLTIMKNALEAGADLVKW